MKITLVIIIIYAIISFTCGIYVIIADKNFLSLIFYFAVGIVLLGNVIGIKKNNFSGIYITLIISLTLTIVFALHLTKTLSLFPGGLMFVSSLTTLGFSVNALRYRTSFNNTEDSDSDEEEIKKD